jgi:hypothetical protein
LPQISFYKLLLSFVFAVLITLFFLISRATRLELFFKIQEEQPKGFYMRSEDLIPPEVNAPEWMAEIDPSVMQKAAAIASRLIEEEGYSEEQANQIALERAQEETPLPIDEELVESDVNAEPLV